jgi:hypothetical protein
MYDEVYKNETNFQTFIPSRGFIDLQQATDTENKFKINNNFNL